MVDYTKELLEFFDGDLEIESIKRIATYEYEIKTKGYYYSHNGYQFPPSTFYHMLKIGLTNIRIMDCKDPKMVGLWELEYLLTIRFTINKKRFEEYLEEVELWQNT